MTLTEYALAFVAVAVGAIAQGSIGFGFGMIAAPVLALIDESLVPGAVLVVGWTIAAIVAWAERAQLDWKGIRWALVGRVVGAIGGAYLISRLSRNGLAVALGALVLAGVVLSVAGWHLRPTGPTLVGAGALSGVMGTLTSVGGPPMALVYQREEAARLRSTLAGFFLFGATLSLITLVAAGEFGGEDLWHGIWLLPGLAAGYALSRVIAGRLSRTTTRRLVLAISTVTSVALIVDGIS